MANENEPVEAAKPPTEDPYDLGDTNLFPKVETKESPPEPTPETSKEEAPVPDRARRPDGTFLPQGKPGEHSEEMRTLALEFGFDDTDLQDMTPEGLRTSIRTMRKNREKFREEQQQARFWADQKKSESKQEPPQGTPAEPQEESYDLGIDESKWEPDVVNLLKSQLGKLYREIASLRKDVETREHIRNTTSNSEKIDAAFAALPANYQRLFGSMSAADMAEGDRPLLRRRIAVLTEAGIKIKEPLGAGLAAKIKKAADLLYAMPEESAPPPPPQGKQAKGAPPIDPKEWRNGGLSYPTQRKGAAEPKGTELAISNLQKKLGEDAVNHQQTDEDILNTLLS